VVFNGSSRAVVDIHGRDEGACSSSLVSGVRVYKYGTAILTQGAIMVNPDNTLVGILVVSIFV
jgi:hypothetical protein